MIDTALIATAILIQLCSWETQNERLRSVLDFLYWPFIIVGVVLAVCDVVKPEYVYPSIGGVLFIFALILQGLNKHSILISILLLGTAVCLVGTFATLIIL